jgi:hypothetical protein
VDSVWVHSTDLSEHRSPLHLAPDESALSLIVGAKESSILYGYLGPRLGLRLDRPLALLKRHENLSPREDADPAVLGIGGPVHDVLATRQMNRRAPPQQDCGDRSMILKDKPEPIVSGGVEVAVLVDSDFDVRAICSLETPAGDVRLDSRRLRLSSCRPG